MTVGLDVMERHTDLSQRFDQILHQEAKGQGCISRLNCHIQIHYVCTNVLYATPDSAVRCWWLLHFSLALLLSVEKEFSRSVRLFYLYLFLLSSFLGTFDVRWRHSMALGYEYVKLVVSVISTFAHFAGQMTSRGPKALAFIRRRPCFVFDRFLFYFFGYLCI